VDVDTLERAWTSLARALDAETLPVGRVISVDQDTAQVDVQGAVGTLQIAPDDRTVSVGNEIRLKCIVFNLKARRAEYVTAESAASES
jgi:hypothetical protein